LPPYSPDLNPIERVWKLARKLCTHNQYFPALVDLVTAVATQLTRWSRPNPTLARLCGII
jgi:transposase